MIAHQRLELVGQLAQDRRGGPRSVLGHESQQEVPTGLLQFTGRLHVRMVRRRAAVVGTNLWRNRAESETEARRLGCF
jgi:hypothetical protein